MKTPTNTCESTCRRQVGAVLPVALIFLVILTIIGVTAMNTSVLDTMMASNTQFQTRALGDAEVVLVEGEDDVVAITTDAVPLDWNTPGDYYYDATATSTETIDPSDWDWAAYDTATAADGASLYVIQYGGREPIPGNTGGYGGSVAYGGAGGGAAGSYVYVFQVTTQADSSRDARRIVQSVYVTDQEP